MCFADAWTGGGNCSTLIYSPMQGDGYANLSSNYYKIYTQVTNYEQCCGLCYNDPICHGWVRVAGQSLVSVDCFLPALNTHPWFPQSAESADCLRD